MWMGMEARGACIIIAGIGTVWRWKGKGVVRRAEALALALGGCGKRLEDAVAMGARGTGRTFSREKMDASAGRGCRARAAEGRPAELPSSSSSSRKSIATWAVLWGVVDVDVDDWDGDGDGWLGLGG